jgi:hypothetical protein
MNENGIKYIRLENSIITSFKCNVLGYIIGESNAGVIKRVGCVYIKGNEHNPPHAHIYIDKDTQYVIDIQTGELIYGNLSRNECKKKDEWFKSIGKSKLIEIWKMNNPNLRN